MGDDSRYILDFSHLHGMIDRFWWIWHILICRIDSIRLQALRRFESACFADMTLYMTILFGMRMAMSELG
jgi:hypothetical protein